MKFIFKIKSLVCIILTVGVLVWASMVWAAEIPVEDTPVSATSIIVGQTLASSTLSGTFKSSTSSPVTGSLNWLASTTVASTTGLFSWVFTPDDLVTYEVATGTVNVVVNLPAMAGTVSITGTTKFGQTLTANIAGLTYTPAAPLDIPTYQWRRSGTNIAGATSSTYTLVAADIAATTTVVVTADGVHATGTVISAATAAISKANGPAAPASPNLYSKTASNITLVEAPLNEFSKNSGVSWQDSPSFSGLAALTSYTFINRIKATATSTESAASSAIVITTNNSSAEGGGGGGSSIIYCTSVTYSDWNPTCTGAFQYRTVTSQAPAYCDLSIAQQLATQRDCPTGASTPSGNTSVGATDGNVVLQNISAESQIMKNNNRETLLSHLGIAANTTLEQNGLVKYKTILGLDKNISALEKLTINNFIVYGTLSTQRLGAGERAAVLNSYFQAYGKLPNSESEWSDVLKIASGRWPTERSAKAEAQAKIEFVKVYDRQANLNNNIDKNAIMVVAYGLLPLQRNLNSEKVSIKTFRWVYAHDPINALAWNVVRSVAYSGAKR